MGQFQTLTTFVQQPLRRGLLALQMPAASRYRLIGHSRVGGLPLSADVFFQQQPNNGSR